MSSLKSLIANYLETQNQSSLIPYLEYPVDSAMGDVAAPCFLLAKELKKSPAQIASELAASFPPHEHIDRIEAVGPYINFFINRSLIGDRLCNIIIKEQQFYGA
jgi:arginyl-tRNA synthetase